MRKRLGTTIGLLTAALVAAPLPLVAGEKVEPLIASFTGLTTVTCGDAPVISSTVSSKLKRPMTLVTGFAGTAGTGTVAPEGQAILALTGKPLDCKAPLVLTATMGTTHGVFATRSYAPARITFPLATPSGEPAGSSYRLKLVATCGAKPKVALQFVAPAAKTSSIVITIGGQSSPPITLTGGKTGSFEADAVLDCTQALPTVSTQVGAGAAQAWSPTAVMYSTALS